MTRHGIENETSTEIEQSNTYRGVLFFYSETGTEGGYWALQDERFILPPELPHFPKGKWSHEGLHILRDGDYLTVYSPTDKEKIVWQGDIDLDGYGLFTQSAFGFWIHADQKGIDRDTWATWFFKQFPAVLGSAPKRSHLASQIS